MDPLLQRLLPPDPRHRRLLTVAAAAVAVVVLALAVALAASTAGGSSTTLPSVRTARVATPSPTPLLVQVAGAVHRPGVVALAAGSRGLDAVAAAGGATARADLAQVALAAAVVDGQRIVVPERGATPAPGAAAPSAAAGGTRISLSAATAEQLETLPRVGSALAARIIAWRTAHGGFRSVADLQQVTGIGPKTFAGLKDLVTP